MASEFNSSFEKKTGQIEESGSFEEGQVEEIQPNEPHNSHSLAAEHTKGDIALKYLHNTHEHQEVPPAIQRRISFKIDLYLVLFMGWCFTLQLADRTVVSGCSVLGIIEDLDMQGSMYSWVTSSLYLGSLVGELPLVFLMQRFGVGKVMGIAYFLWAVVLTVSASTRSYAGFISTRVLLGIFESGMIPAFNTITAQWLPRRSHFSRTCFWNGLEGFGTILTNAVAYGIYVHRESINVAPWRVLIIIFGLMTLVTSVVFYFHIPNNPSEAWFLSEDERAWHVHIIREHNASIRYGTPVIKRYQIREALFDPATWLAFAYCLLSMISNGASGGFSNILYEGLGFASVNKSLLLGIAAGGVEVVGCLLTGICSMLVFKDHRMAYALFFAAGNVLCFCLLAWGPNNGSQLFGYLVGANWTINIGIIALLSNIASNTGGYTKMFTVDAIFYFGFGIGNIVGPLSFKSSESPTFTTGKLTMATTNAVAFVMMFLLMLLNVGRNMQRNKVDKKLPSEIEDPEFADLTDLENPEFRYAM